MSECIFPPFFTKKVVFVVPVVVKKQNPFLPDPKIIVSLRRKSYRYEIPHRHTDIREHHQ